MSSLSDRIDHLEKVAKAVRTSAVAIIPSEDTPTPCAIPFTRAVLDTTLGDLIRDIDASELGLFTIVPAPDADIRKQSNNDTRRGEISRAEFPGATPLRAQTVRRGDMFKPKEYEPEIYAHAALKYLDRYQSIRHMPRARSQVIAIIERLNETRQNIERLNDTLQELTVAGATSGLTPSITGVAQEEGRITDLQNRLTELRNQKDAILRSNGSKPAFKPIPKPALPRSPEPGNPEDVFWSTPAASARTLRFTDRLLEEEPDFAELSAISFDSPGPAPPKSVFARLAASAMPAKKGLGTLTEGIISGGPQVHKSKEETEEGLDDGSSLLDIQFEPEFDNETSVPDAPDVETEDNPDEERTVMLSKISPSTPADLPLPFTEDIDIQPQTTTPLIEAHSSSRVTRLCVTPELENIVTRIWCTVGDILLPGKGGEKALRARETLALIESLTIQSPSASSPTSTSSISSITSTTAGRTPHQVNTAQLLHALLTAPNHAMPLNRLKAAIGGTRALYSCVAKKLIRIDRGGGEQIVLFET